MTSYLENLTFSPACLVLKFTACCILMCTAWKTIFYIVHNILLFSLTTLLLPKHQCFFSTAVGFRCFALFIISHIEVISKVLEVHFDIYMEALHLQKNMLKTTLTQLMTMLRQKILDTVVKTCATKPIFCDWLEKIQKSWKPWEILETSSWIPFKYLPTVTGQWYTVLSVIKITWLDLCFQGWFISPTIKSLLEAEFWPYVFLRN